ncbi:MAG: DUF4352 domain-containing protein [Desulfurococcales archaeon]|nr:DUF4352 domain-containing protein [Desulfurococcales archaeon]
MRSRKGISPVIATVIIVAVAIAISIAVAGWLMGLWRGFGAVEQLTVMPDSSLIVSNGTSTLVLHIKNTGSKAAVIEKVVVSGLGTFTYSGGDSTTINQGADSTLTYTAAVAAVPGTQYLVQVYTSSGAVYQGYVVAQSS